MNCEHKRTKIWEPHLAGARKCLDCERVYNPNCTPSWFFEDLQLSNSLRQRYFTESVFCRVVDSLTIIMLEHQLSPDDLADALTVAKVKFHLDSSRRDHK